MHFQWNLYDWCCQISMGKNSWITLKNLRQRLDFLDAVKQTFWALRVFIQDWLWWFLLPWFIETLIVVRVWSGYSIGQFGDSMFQGPLNSLMVCATLFIPVWLPYRCCQEYKEIIIFSPLFYDNLINSATVLTVRVKVFWYLLCCVLSWSRCDLKKAHGYCYVSNSCDCAIIFF